MVLIQFKKLLRNEYPDSYTMEVVPIIIVLHLNIQGESMISKVFRLKTILSKFGTRKDFLCYSDKKVSPSPCCVVLCCSAFQLYAFKSEFVTSFQVLKST
jgi:hypothetical protein